MLEGLEHTEPTPVARARGLQGSQPSSLDGLARPRAAQLTDLVRATVAFQDPYAMAAFYALLCRSSMLKIVRLKNKLMDEELDPDSRLNLHINAAVENHVCEIQLTFFDYTQIKRYSHK